MDKGREKIAGAALFACGLACAAGIAAGRGAGQELNGPVSRERILNVCPESRFERDAYAPAAGVLDRIRASASSIRVEAFFAAADPEQVRAVGRLMKVEDGVASFNFNTEFTALSGPADPIAVQRSLDSLPAFIVFVDGAEAGRIAGPSDSALEYALASFLPPPASEGDDLSDPAGEDVYADRDYFRGIPHAHLPLDCTRCHRPR